MSTLAEIEAAADELTKEEQEKLITHLTAQLGRHHSPVVRTRVELPLIESSRPDLLHLDNELIARLEIEAEVERYEASLRQ